MSPAAPRGASHARGKTYGGGLLDNPVQIAYRRRSGSAGTREGVADGAGALRLERLRNPSSHRDGAASKPGAAAGTSGQLPEGEPCEAASEPDMAEEDQPLCGARAWPVVYAHPAPPGNLLWPTLKAILTDNTLVPGQT